jgi:hypothetical protein
VLAQQVIEGHALDEHSFAGSLPHGGMTIIEGSRFETRVLRHRRGGYELKLLTRLLPDATMVDASATIRG